MKLFHVIYIYICLWLIFVKKMNCVLFEQNYSLKMLKYHILIISVFYVLKSWFYDVNSVNTDTDGPVESVRIN